MYKTASKKSLYGYTKCYEKNIYELSDDRLFDEEESIERYIHYLKLLSDIEEGFIYIGQADDNQFIYKIGKTINATKRIKHLKLRGHKFKLILVRPCSNMSKVESMLHKELKEYCIGQELFEIHDINIIKEALNAVKNKLHDDNNKQSDRP